MAAEAAMWAGPSDCRACCGTGFGPIVRSVYGRTAREVIAEAR